MKFGIIGSGRIAGRFAKEIHFVDGAELTHVYNPHRESAEAFAGAHGLTAADSLEVLFSAVDAVYIATPHATHYEYTAAALSAGKHVLCEKPLTLSADSAEDLFARADEKGLCLMEAVKTEFCPGYRALIETAKSGIIGKIVGVEAAFTRLTPPGGREYTDLSTGGSFTEFGTYCLLPIADLLGTNFSDVRFSSLPAETGVDAFTKADFSYGVAARSPLASGPDRNEKFKADGAEALEAGADGMLISCQAVFAFASIKTGLSAKTEGQLLISGTEGYILAPSPWWLTKAFDVRFEDPKKVLHREFPFEGDGLRYEIAEFQRRTEDPSRREEEGAGRKRAIAWGRLAETFLRDRKANFDG